MGSTMESGVILRGPVDGAVVVLVVAHGSRAFEEFVGGGAGDEREVVLVRQVHSQLDVNSTIRPTISDTIMQARTAWGVQRCRRRLQTASPVGGPPPSGVACPQGVEG
jgi:hypothetical protein